MQTYKDDGHQGSWTHQEPWSQQERNDKDDAQPPRLRQTKQASPPDLKIYLYLFLCFQKKPLTLLTLCAEKEY